MKISRAYGLSTAIIAMLVAAQSTEVGAQTSPQPMTAAAPAADKPIPRVGPDGPAAYGGRPDFRGAWMSQRRSNWGQAKGPLSKESRARRAMSFLMFDPENAYMEPDPAGDDGGLDFGPMPGSFNTKIPYKPEFQKEYNQIVADAKKGIVADRVGLCEPYGMPRLMAMGPKYIMYDRDMIAMVASNEMRFIYMDGRPHPSGVDVLKSWEGHSTGHWEGDTLVVDTVDIHRGNYDQSNAKHSDQIHVIERMRLIDADTMENEITTIDPVMFKAPWVVKRTYFRGPAGTPNMPADMCPPDNNVIIDKNGGQNVVLPFEEEKPK